MKARKNSSLSRNSLKDLLYKAIDSFNHHAVIRILEVFEYVQDELDVKYQPIFRIFKGEPISENSINFRGWLMREFMFRIALILGHGALFDVLKPLDDFSPNDYLIEACSRDKRNSVAWLATTIKTKNYYDDPLTSLLPDLLLDKRSRISLETLKIFKNDPFYNDTLDRCLRNALKAEYQPLVNQILGSFGAFLMITLLSSA